jgi:polar amino acid transport system substrate-binding protein
MQLNKKNRLVVANNDQSHVKHQAKKLLFITLILLIYSLRVNAENNPVIHIVTEHLPPYQIVTKNQSLSGFAVDIITETMARSHYAYSLKSYPWVRSYNLAQVKANHCIFSIARLKSRESLFKWVGPISHVNNTALWARKGRTIKVSNLNDAKKYIIAVNRDDIGHIGLLERGFNEAEHLYVLDNTKSLISLLLTRPEIDLIVADDTTIKFRTELAGATINDLQRIYEIKDLPLNFFFACSKQTDDDIIKHLSEKLQSLYQDGSYDAIWEKWRGKLISVK